MIVYVMVASSPPSVSFRPNLEQDVFRPCYWRFYTVFRSSYVRILAPAPLLAEVGVLNGLKSRDKNAQYLLAPKSSRASQVFRSCSIDSSERLVILSLVCCCFSEHEHSTETIAQIAAEQFPLRQGVVPHLATARSPLHARTKFI